MALSPEQRKLRAQAAAYARWSRHDPKEAMAKVREGFHARFLDEVDPGRVLPEVERRRRAVAAMNAHMKSLALASSRKRSKPAQVDDEPEAVAG